MSAESKARAAYAHIMRKQPIRAIEVAPGTRFVFVERFQTIQVFGRSDIRRTTEQIRVTEFIFADPATGPVRIAIDTDRETVYYAAEPAESAGEK